MLHSYLGVMGAALSPPLASAEAQTEESTDVDFIFGEDGILVEAIVARATFSRKLFVCYVCLTTGSTSTIVGTCKPCNGFETWRRLAQRCHTKSAFDGISYINFGGSFPGAQFRGVLRIWENELVKFETSADTTLPDMIKSAIL